jgi:hypothetical protein
MSIPKRLKGTFSFHKRNYPKSHKQLCYHIAIFLEAEAKTPVNDRMVTGTMIAMVPKEVFRRTSIESERMTILILILILVLILILTNLAAAAPLDSLGDTLVRGRSRKMLWAPLLDGGQKDVTALILCLTNLITPTASLQATNKPKIHNYDQTPDSKATADRELHHLRLRDPAGVVRLDSITQTSETLQQPPGTDSLSGLPNLRAVAPPIIHQVAQRRTTKTYMVATNVRIKQVVLHSQRRKNLVLHRTSFRGRFLGHKSQPIPKSQNATPSHFWFEPATFPSKGGAIT